MCRTGASPSAHTQCSPNETYEDSHAKAAAKQQQPNLPECNAELNLKDSMSVFLFDWDDTLFPTTALTSLGPEHLREALKTVDTIVAELLASLASPRSCVVILTNANLSWVHHAAENFLPKVKALFGAPDSQILLISAHRDRAQLPEQGSPAYHEAVRRSKSEAVRPLATVVEKVARESQAQSLQVIGIGDQPHDLAAAHALRGLMCDIKESFVKTVLMKRMPTGTELARQLGTLCRSLPMLLTIARSFHQSMHQAQTTSEVPTAPAQRAAECKTPAAPAASKSMADEGSQCTQGL